MAAEAAAEAFGDGSALVNASTNPTTAAVITALRTAARQDRTTHLPPA
ncbi:hypothetical protein [Streptomyces hydrogenans]